jgi:hypothetical protein
MRKWTVGLLSAAALATTILLVRQQKVVAPEEPRVVPAGDAQPEPVSLDRLRELGL